MSGSARRHGLQPVPHGRDDRDDGEQRHVGTRQRDHADPPGRVRDAPGAEEQPDPGRERERKRRVAENPAQQRQKSRVAVEVIPAPADDEKRGEGRRHDAGDTANAPGCRAAAQLMHDGDAAVDERDQQKRRGDEDECDQAQPRPRRDGGQQELPHVLEHEPRRHPEAVQDERRGQQAHGVWPSPKTRSNEQGHRDEGRAQREEQAEDDGGGHRGILALTPRP